MKTTYLSVVWFLILANQSFALQIDPDPRIKNESSFTFVPHGTQLSGQDYLNDLTGSTYCSGTIEGFDDELKRIGHSKETVAQQVQCTIGDFDGNGYLDFVLWGKATESHSRVTHLVVFYEKARVIRTILIRLEPYDVPAYYSPTGELTTTIRKGPRLKHDAFYFPGETHGYTDYSKGTLYIFNPESNSFQVRKFSGTK